MSDYDPGESLSPAKRRILLAAAVSLALALALAGWVGFKASSAEAFASRFLDRLREPADPAALPGLRERATLFPRELAPLKEQHLRFAEPPPPTEEELPRLPLAAGAPPSPRRAPFLRYGKGLEPKLKTFKELLRAMPTLLKDVAAVAEPRDLGVAPENAASPLLEEPFLADAAVFLVQLAAGAASLGRLDMAALLATFPCHLGVASSNRGQGFGNAASLATHANALGRYKLGAAALLALAEGPLPAPALQAVENAGRALDFMKPLRDVIRRERDLWLDALERIAGEPPLFAKEDRARVDRLLATLRGEFDAALAPLLEALDRGDMAAARAALPALDAAREEARARAAVSGLAALRLGFLTPDRLFLDRLARVPDLAALVEAEAEARALGAALVVAARLGRLEAEGKHPSTAGYFETLSGAKLPPSAYEPKRTVDLRFENGRATVVDDGRIFFSRPWETK